MNAEPGQPILPQMAIQALVESLELVLSGVTSTPWAPSDVAVASSSELSQMCRGRGRSIVMKLHYV